ncbi:MAG: divalent metal cation transporter [Fulvivirga sp.]|uniref:NRAMP family divalent metal transporter n=1 Tax=Fulvivirga sp. TaxID=1931237 RepID=UPI0032EF8B74
MTDSVKNLIKTFGPGIVFAGMCIGVSHLVQSTRAGADYGFILLPAVLAAVIFKYPFFEFSSRYTSATGKSILYGYDNLGRWILWLYGIVNVLTMFIVTAAIAFVAAGLMSTILQVEIGADVLAALILLICVIILAAGKYSALDGLLKVVSTVLLISTLIAAFVAFNNGSKPPVEGFVPNEVLSVVGITFLIALMGWMPTAVDMSAWTGLWAEERIKQTSYTPTLKETLLDFNIGYAITGVLAVVFLSLGALVMYGTGIELSNNSSSFAAQLISLYTNSIGEWSYLIIAVAAFSTMFSTSITVLDGYGRAMNKVYVIISGQEKKWNYTFWVVIVALGAYFVLSQYLNNLKSLVDLATTISFIIAPLAAILNYKVIFSSEVDKNLQPPLWLKTLAKAGIVFLSAFTLIYFYVLFIGL